MKCHSIWALGMTAHGVATRARCVGPVVLIVVASVSSADIIHVPGDHATIQAGIDAANPGDEVVVAPGTYLENISFSGKAITLISTDPTDPEVVAGTIIDASGSGRVVTCNSSEGPDTVLEGFTITGGDTGMFNDGSSPTVTNCTFEGNIARGDLGGGMTNFNGSPTVSNCTFVNKSAEFGGGMANIDSSSPTVTNCTFSGNTADDGGGGGMVNWGGTSPTVTDCTFQGNIVNGGEYTGGGGGMLSDCGASATVTNCTFSGNWAGYGGGMNTCGSSTLTNCVFNGNSASTGGGMATAWGRPTVINCSFTGNTADTGGGIFGYTTRMTVTNCTFGDNSAAHGRAFAFAHNWQYPPGRLILSNSILWDGGDEIWDNDGSTITINYTNVQGGFAGIGNIDADPLFVDPDNGDLRLQPGSPCIDAGDTTAVPLGITTDLGGNPRFADDHCTPDTGNPDDTNPPVDMGAYEYQPPCPADLDCSGTVDFGEVVAILSAWGSCTGCPEDLNGDDAVGLSDLLIALSAWGPCPLHSYRFRQPSGW